MLFKILKYSKKYTVWKYYVYYVSIEKMCVICVSIHDMHHISIVLSLKDELVPNGILSRVYTVVHATPFGISAYVVSILRTIRYHSFQRNHFRV